MLVHWVGHLGHFGYTGEYEVYAMERNNSSDQTTTTTRQIQEHKRALRQPPSAKEIARRQAVGAELVALRNELLPLDISVTDLLRQARATEDTALDG